MEQVNWYGAYSLMMREIKRFLRVYNQTIIAPVVLALIYLSVFVLAIGDSKPDINGIKFVNFTGYGLIVMSIIQNAFANSSSSFIMSKVIGYISDILIPPLGSLEIILAFTAGAICRGVIVGIAVSIALSPFVDYEVHHPILLIFIIISSCALLGQTGVFAGMVAKSFDQNAAVNNYIVVPLSFLSGTFYSVKNLPEYLQYINIFNPFFYIIDGFRYCLTNHADGNIAGGVVCLLCANMLMFSLLVRLFDAGWRIKG